MNSRPVLPLPWRQSMSSRPVLPRPWRPSMNSRPVLPRPWRPSMNSRPVLPLPWRQSMSSRPVLPRPWRPSMNSRPVLPRPWRASVIPPSGHVTATEAIWGFLSCPGTAMKAACDSQTCSATAPETGKALPVLSVSTLLCRLSLLSLFFPRSQTQSWFPAWFTVLPRSGGLRSRLLRPGGLLVRLLRPGGLQCHPLRLGFHMDLALRPSPCSASAPPPT